MEIVLSPELEQLVQRQLERGPYQTPLEVLLAGVQLLEHNAQPARNEVYGELDPSLTFVPRTEAEMVQHSLDVLANYQGDAIPHDQVEAWVNGLGSDPERPCPQ
ncbi:hypothetical protein VB780_08000 [Leptolyngbya sp. CCNP1308]|uniref:hypothetical protein n=1 Tax=Leptolyngbya sp. CCNP1308 TaxID=3110255 RepID=UPI002B200E4D|nr:hypothetical protein [Leptolyngbya sp. CCNP1308]MEA5448504.1 hypothetical protein [Leptolyngbya sp. CCNP1308]